MRAGKQGFRQVAQERDRAVDAAAHVQPHVRRYLIVAGARRVQFLARVSDAAHEFAFHKGMDILRARNGERSVFDFGKDFFQSVADRLRFLRRDNILFAEHGRVRDGSGDVRLIEFFVER